MGQSSDSSQNETAKLFCVTVTAGGKSTTSYLRLAEFTIGRSPMNGLMLDIDDLSETHLAVNCQGTDILIFDQESASGTFVNGQQIAANEIYQYQVGDKITLGEADCTVQLQLFQVATSPSVLQLDNNQILDLRKSAELQAAELIAGAQQRAQEILRDASRRADDQIKESDEIVEKVRQNAQAEFEALISNAQKDSVEIKSAVDRASEKVMSDARTFARELIEKGQAEVAQMHLKIQNEAREIRQRGEAGVTDLFKVANDKLALKFQSANEECEVILRRGREQAEAFIAAAKDETGHILQQAREGAVTITQQAQNEAHESSRRIKEQAESEAKLIINGAEARSIDVFKNNQSKADQMLDSARERADRIFNAAKEKSIRMVQATRMQAAKDRMTEVEEILSQARRQVDVMKENARATEEAAAAKVIDEAHKLANQLFKERLAEVERISETARLETRKVCEDLMTHQHNENRSLLESARENALAIQRKAEGEASERRKQVEAEINDMRGKERLRIKMVWRHLKKASDSRRLQDIEGLVKNIEAGLPTALVSAATGKITPDKIGSVISYLNGLIQRSLATSEWNGQRHTLSIWSRLNLTIQGLLPMSRKEISSADAITQTGEHKATKLRVVS